MSLNHYEWPTAISGWVFKCGFFFFNFKCVLLLDQDSLYADNLKV